MHDLKDLARVFARLGATSFGGPLAHIALMEEEFVQKRKLLSHQEFMDMYALTQMIPGPNSTEMAMHIGYKLMGWRGLFVGGSLFILPAFVMVLFIAIFYKLFSEWAWVASILSSVATVVVSILTVTVLRLFKGMKKDRAFWTALLVTLVCGLLGVPELVIFFGLITMTLFKFKPHLSLIILPLVMSFSEVMAKTAPRVLNHFDTLFWYFLKVGSVLFGSGYVLFAFLENGLVMRMNLISRTDLINAIAVGQVTPGPLFTSATFIGYQVSGLLGAIIATIAIFTPAFFFVALSVTYYEKIKNNQLFKEILGVLVASSFGLMLLMLIHFFKAAISVPFEWVAIVVSIVLLLGTKIGPQRLLLLAVLVGSVRVFF